MLSPADWGPWREGEGEGEREGGRERGRGKGGGRGGDDENCWYSRNSYTVLTLSTPRVPPKLGRNCIKSINT